MGKTRRGAAWKRQKAERRAKREERMKEAMAGERGPARSPGSYQAPPVWLELIEGGKSDGCKSRSS